MKTFRDYMNKASDTAIYPYRGELNGLDYCITAMAGEVGEVLNKLKKVMRDNNWKLNKENKKGLSAECAGACWYISQIFYELGFESELLDYDLYDYQEDTYEEFKDTEQYNIENKVKQLKHVLTEAYVFCANNLIVINDFEKGKIKEEDYNEYTNKIAVNTIKSLSIMSIVCSCVGLSLKEVLQANIDLLQARKENNTIQGSGDGILNRGEN